MTTAEKPKEGTAVAAPKRDALANLPPQIRAAIEMRRMLNVTAAELAKLNWGSKVDEQTRRAVADWCYRNDVDPQTEIDILGNRFYPNAAWHLRKLGEMTAAGLVEYAVADHVESDARLAKLVEAGDEAVSPKAQAELSRRLFERIAHGVPDNALAAVVFRIKLRSMEQEVTGVSWCGGGSRKNDPVGDDRPGPTAETRAARRAIRPIALKAPEVAAILEAGEAEAQVIGEKIHEQVKAIDAQRPAHVQIPVKSSADPFEERGDAAEDTE